MCDLRSNNTIVISSNSTWDLLGNSGEGNRLWGSDLVITRQYQRTKTASNSGMGLSPSRIALVTSKFGSWIGFGLKKQYLANRWTLLSMTMATDWLANDYSAVLVTVEGTAYQIPMTAIPAGWIRIDRVCSRRARDPGHPLQEWCRMARQLPQQSRISKQQ